jgi:hypothetical protein
LYYLSTYHTAHEYYCDVDTDANYQNLDYVLKTPIPLAQVLTQYPGRTLHEPCDVAADDDGS